MANNFKGFESSNITTKKAIYTSPASTQTTVIGMSIANTSGNATLASVLKNNTYIIKNAPVPNGGTLIPVGGDQKLVLEPNDKIYISADHTVDVVLSVLEIN